MLREVAHFLRVAPAAWRLQHRMSFLDAYDLVEHDLDDAGKRQFRAALVADLDRLVVEIGAGLRPVLTPSGSAGTNPAAIGRMRDSTARR